MPIDHSATHAAALYPQPQPKTSVNLSTNHGSLHMAYTLKNHFAHKPLTLIDAQVKDEELKAMFNSIDKDGDGFFSADDLFVFFKTNPGETRPDGEIENEIKKIMGEADVDRDGKINYAEFVKYDAQMQENGLKAFFSSIDKDGDGFISADELFGYYKTNLGEDFPRGAIDQMMGEADKNKDGKLNYEEFVIQMKGTCSLPRIPTTVSSPRGNLLTSQAACFRPSPRSLALLALLALLAVLLDAL